MAVNTMGRGAGARRKALSCHGINNARGYNSTYEDVPDMSRTNPDTVHRKDTMKMTRKRLRRCKLRSRRAFRRLKFQQYFVDELAPITQEQWDYIIKNSTPYTP
jgi:hypothetical protein